MSTVSIWEWDKASPEQRLRISNFRVFFLATATDWKSSRYKKKRTIRLVQYMDDHLSLARTSGDMF